MTRNGPSTRNLWSPTIGGAGLFLVHDRCGGGEPAAPQVSRTRLPTAAWMRRLNDVIFAGARTRHEVIELLHSWI